VLQTRFGQRATLWDKKAYDRSLNLHPENIRAVDSRAENEETFGSLGAMKS